MNTSSLIRDLCKEKHISLSELARRIGQSPQNFMKKMRRETLTTEEYIQIANSLEVKYEQSFTLKSGEKFSITN